MLNFLQIKSKNILVGLFLLSLLILPNLTQAFEFKNSLNEAGVGAGYDKTGGMKSEPVELLQKPIIMIISLVGVIFLILMIYGGFLWMSAKGNTKQIDTAKAIIEAAVIGLIVVSSAYAISTFVMMRLGSIGGATLE